MRSPSQLPRRCGPPWGGCFGALLGLALGLASLGSCLGELPRGRSCGDGWWDPEFEPCDPSSPDRSYVSACRDQGFDVDAVCNDLCEIESSEADCTRCGDGIASGDEPCDGNDLRDAECPSGSGLVRCTDTCELDFESCPAVCGDGIVNGTEECDVSLSCGTDEDCGEGRVCYLQTGECVPSDGGFGPNLSCSFYETRAISEDKPYAGGTVAPCTDDCFFGRNECDFCGDGERDDEYQDFVFPNGELGDFPAELCDGEEAIPEELEDYCEPLCVDDPINANVVLFCDFECNDTCSNFAPPDDIVPGENPQAIGCCAAQGSPCPGLGTPGVPALPCCSWLENPEWLEQQECVTGDQIPIGQVCP